MVIIVIIIVGTTTPVLFFYSFCSLQQLQQHNYFHIIRTWALLCGSILLMKQPQHKQRHTQLYPLGRFLFFTDIVIMAS